MAQEGKAMWVIEAKRVMEAMKVTETLRFMEATKVGGGVAQEVLQLSKSPLTYESSKWAWPLSTCLRVFKKYLFLPQFFFQSDFYDTYTCFTVKK